MACSPDLFEQFALRVLPPDLTDSAQARLKALTKRANLKANTSLEPTEADPQWVFIGSGATKLVAHASQSRDQIIAFHFAGDVCVVPARDNYSYSIQALTESELLLVHGSAFLDLAASEPGILRQLLESTTMSLRRCREKTIALGRKTAGERIAVFMLAMAERIGVQEGRTVTLDLPMSRREIAESLGLTIETVCRQISLLRGSQSILTSGRSTIILRDIDQMRAHAGYLEQIA